MHTGNYVLILHTHLPWVLHHGNWPHGEDWLTEAAAECYIPLLNVFNDLLNEGIVSKVSLGISPVLCEQLEHKDFKLIFDNYCNQKIAKAKEDERNFTDWGYHPHHIWLAKFWQNWYSERLNDYLTKYDSSIIGAFKKLQDEGVVEILTCGATHGYLPLLGTENSIELQIHTAVENYKKHFGRKPNGIWLPECAYRPSYEWKSYLPIQPFNSVHLRPGIEQVLAKYDISYFVTDEDLITRSMPMGVFTDSSKQMFVPCTAPGFEFRPWNFTKSPLEIYNVSSSEQVQWGTAAVFTRHHDISMQVWSGEVGYPGEPDYLDFHKKQVGSMLRYWRVTDSKADMMYKTLYHPDWIWKKLDHQSNHFVHHIENTLNWNNNDTHKFGTLCTPFDTELFGHWWFEGPEFLRMVLRGLAKSPWVNTVTASEQLKTIKPLEVIRMPEGSWGENNNHDVWINPETIWTWEAIYNNENRLKSIFEKYLQGDLNSIQTEIINQALREMMLLQSSDWQFLIHTQSAKDYAEQRFSFHHSDFNKLLDIFEKTFVDDISTEELNYLRTTESRNSIFKELDYHWWSNK